MWVCFFLRQLLHSHLVSLTQTEEADHMTGILTMHCFSHAVFKPPCNLFPSSNTHDFHEGFDSWLISWTRCTVHTESTDVRTACNYFFCVQYLMYCSCFMKWLCWESRWYGGNVEESRNMKVSEFTRFVDCSLNFCLGKNRFGFYCGRGKLSLQCLISI